MVRVNIRERETLDDALRRFNKLVEKEGITAKAKEHMFYIKPSKLKRDKENKARRKLEKKRRKDIRN
ncbi:MAG: 30S ribosomal protein S21 [Spirochaetes bacterium]|nr:30S ribosomal protein S21 [Spirochaetota bacterium]